MKTPTYLATTSLAGRSLRATASLATASLAFVLVAAALLALPAAGQMAADALFSDFEPNGEYVFVLDGKALKDAEIFQSKRAGAFLIMAAELASPVIINARAQQVQSVHIMKVARRDSGKVDILADASFDSLGGFSFKEGKVSFAIGDRKAVLEEKPPLLGWRQAEELTDYKVEYVRGAAAYTPSAEHLGLLQRQQKAVEVKVYFATWCPACTRAVPKVLKVQAGLADSKIRFSYYGLPHKVDEDPIAREVEIKGIPTVVVHVAGKEVGRLSISDLNAPEKALHQLVAKAE